MVCILAVASSQKYSMYSTADCSGDASSSASFNVCEKPKGGDKYQKITIDGGTCKKGMKYITQKYSDKDCATKDGEEVKLEWKGDVDKCIDSSITVLNVTTKLSTKLSCSPASVKTFMPVMTVFAMVVAMFSQ
jgi:hypothetical protein